LIAAQAHLRGTVTLRLYKGNEIVTRRSSPNALYSAAHVTFEDDAGACDQKDAEGFIRLHALRLRRLRVATRSQTAAGGRFPFLRPEAGIETRSDR
jgi:argininosuccinate synthase